MALLSEVSKATISRMENGSKTFEYYNIEKIAVVFGLNVDDFSKREFSFPTEIQIKNAIKRYIKENKPDIDFATLIKKKPGAAYYIEKMLKTNFLNNPREMSEIVKFCKAEYNVDLKGDAIGNVLKRREIKGLIIRIAIKGTNNYIYQKKI